MKSVSPLLVARDAKDRGTVKWEISFGEKIDVMCAAASEVAVEIVMRAQMLRAR